MKKYARCFISGLLVCLSVFTLVGCGSGPVPEWTTGPTETAPEATAPKATQPPEVDVKDQRMLRMDAVVDKDAQFTTIPREELGGNYDDDLCYLNVTNVSIDVDGEKYHLEDAIRDGVISVEEITAYARMDARMGYCTERTETYHSLTYFIYHYPEFDLRLTHDILKSPDGQEHLVNEFYVCANAHELFTTYHDLGREDWGLSFEVVEATSTSLTFDCIQSGGQQIGELKPRGYWIYTVDGEGNLGELDHSDDSSVTDLSGKLPVLTRDDTTRITIKWKDFYGNLPKGNYVLDLGIRDEFDQADVHPLMEDFQTGLWYRIEFTVP